MSKYKKLTEAQEKKEFEDKVRDVSYSIKRLSNRQLTLLQQNIMHEVWDRMQEEQE